MSHRFLSTALLALPLAFTGCASDPGDPGDAPATIMVHASLIGTMVATVVVEISAADIANPLVFNLTVVNDAATGSLTVPAGSDRSISVRAYDAGGVQTHAGSATVDVQPNAILGVALTLDALTGDVDLEVTLGRVTVAVSPPSASLTVGATLSLAATITDEHGDPVASALPDWATTHPAVATVDAAGLVTAVAPGQTTLAATFGGAAGHTLVTVTAEP